MDPAAVGTTAELISKYGFQTIGLIVLFVALCFIVRKIFDMWEKDRQTFAKRSDDFSDALKDFGDSLNTSNETNRLLVDKIEDKVQDIDNKTNTIIEKLNSISK